MDIPRRASPVPSALLGCVVAGAIGGLAGAALVMVWQPGNQVALPAPIQSDTGELRERLDRLEAELRRPAPVAVPAGGAEAAGAVVREAPPAVEDPAVLRRLQALEQAVAAFGKRPVGGPVSGGPGGAPVVDDALAKSRAIAANQATILDPGRTDQERLAAWADLRREENGWNDGVVAMMTQMGLSNASAAVRADVWRQADARAKHPAMGQALLQALQVDQEATVREEAAETLENYLDLPGVREALVAARDRDTDAKVRRQAEETLSASEKKR